MADLKIKRKEFISWLKEHPDLFFSRNDTCECPIAVYLGAGCDRDVEVEHDFTAIDSEPFDNPPWVRNFTEAVDQVEGYISAREALDLL